jgi:syringate O-demethylase
MKPYRQWLPADGYEARASIGGSFVSKRIEDYYLSPWDMGYGSFIDFEHDFIGREALQKMAKGPHRRKVTLALDDADVLRAIGSQLGSGERAKFIEFPSAVYSMHPYDKVLAKGRTVGISTWIGYSSNERKMLTIAVLEPEFAEPGTEVSFVWGEEGGGTKKPTVERHKQMEIRAVVSPVPYVEAVRKTYTERGWRTQATV